MKRGANDPRPGELRKHLYDLAILMERPFFALGARPPSELPLYVSPSKQEPRLTLRVSATTPACGVATLQDADVLIYLTSLIRWKQVRLEIDDIESFLAISPSDLLSTIGRDTGGRQHRLLKDSLQRLSLTETTTNIGPSGGLDIQRSFRMIEAWRWDERKLEIRLGDWLIEAILNHNKHRHINPAYFDLRVGYERWLYRVACKHAGQQTMGWTGRLRMLHKKSGSLSPYARFEADIRKLLPQLNLPGFVVDLIEADVKDPEPRLRFKAGRRRHVQPAGELSFPLFEDKPQSASDPLNSVPDVWSFGT